MSDVYVDNPWIMLIIFQQYYPKLRVTSRLYWHDWLSPPANSAHQFPDYFFIFLSTWDPMGGKTAKRYSSHKSLLNVLKLLLIFFLQYPHKVTFSDFWNFEILNFKGFFFPFPLRWDHVAENVLLLPQIATESFQALPEVLSSTFSQSYFSDFWNFVYFKFYGTLKFSMGVNGKTQNDWLKKDFPWLSCTLG